MKKLLKEVAVLAMAAVVAVSSVSGVQAAVASPTASVVPVDKKNVTTTEGNNVDTKADGTAEINDVTVNKNIATVPGTVTVDRVTYTVTVIKAKAFAKTAKKVKKIIVKGTKSFTVKKGAFKGLNSAKITVKVNKKMKAKEFKKLKKNLKKAGFKGKVTK